MSIDLNAFEAYVKILVIGIGGGGSNAVNEMIDDGMMKNIDFWVVNTDAQALSTSKSPNRMVLGEEVTKGLGAGGDPSVGEKAAEANKEQLEEIIRNYDMVFLACGEGGGTGTGAAPVIAKIAKDLDILTVAIITRPFTFEGNLRMKRANEGIAKLKENVDSLIIVSNDKLMFMNGKRAIKDAFAESDSVLAQSVKTITDLILLPGVINLDFADIRNTLKNKGMALIGFGSGEGDNKAKDAANSAVSCPLLEASIKGAKTAIVNITCGSNVTLDEAQEAVRYITEIAGGDVNIIFGIQLNSQIDNTMLVSVIATEFEDESQLLNPSSIIPSRSLVNKPEISRISDDTNSSSGAQNPAQVADSRPDFSNEDDILPNFFSTVKKQEETQAEKSEEVEENEHEEEENNGNGGEENGYNAY